jgi:hypothetical protein
MSVDVSPSAISERLAAVSRLSDLHAGKRLDAKIDLSPAGISLRLREASELNELCRSLRGIEVVPTR